MGKSCPVIDRGPGFHGVDAVLVLFSTRLTLVIDSIYCQIAIGDSIQLRGVDG
jgi:hypothetical protein